MFKHLFTSRCAAKLSFFSKCCVWMMDQNIWVILLLKFSAISLICNFENQPCSRMSRFWTFYSVCLLSNIVRLFLNCLGSRHLKIKKRLEREKRPECQLLKIILNLLWLRVEIPCMIFFKRLAFEEPDYFQRVDKTFKNAGIYDSYIHYPIKECHTTNSTKSLKILIKRTMQCQRLGKFILIYLYS